MNMFSYTRSFLGIKVCRSKQVSPSHIRVVTHADTLKLAMPSKGIDFYSYVSLPDADVEFSVPGKRILFRDYSNNYTGDHLEVEYANTDIVGDGEVKWEVHGTTNTVIASRSVGVNSLFGMMGGDHLVPLETPAIFGDDFCVCYGW